jgi:hypothetical protein
VRMTESRPVIWPWVRETLQALRPAHEALDATRLNLILSTPVIPKENILLIEAIHDLFAESQPIEELWQKWQQPEIWRLPHGHISALFAPGLTGRVLRWLAPRLKKPFSRDQRTPPNHALQRTRPSRSGCNSRVPRAGSLSSAAKESAALGWPTMNNFG